MHMRNEGAKLRKWHDSRSRRTEKDLGIRKITPVLFLWEILVLCIITNLGTFPSPSLALNVRTDTSNCPFQIDMPIFPLPRFLLLVLEGEGKGGQIRLKWDAIPLFQMPKSILPLSVVLNHPKIVPFSVKKCTSWPTLKIPAQVPSSLSHKKRVLVSIYFLKHYKFSTELECVFPKGGHIPDGTQNFKWLTFCSYIF